MCESGGTVAWLEMIQKLLFFIFNPFSVYTESITFHSSVSGVGKSHFSSLNPPLFQYK